MSIGDISEKQTIICRFSTNRMSVINIPYVNNRHNNKKNNNIYILKKDDATLKSSEFGRPITLVVLKLFKFHTTKNTKEKEKD